ncbi:MAG: hypothetical protein J0H99_24135, partial [Rhodospirillales bacterium]|nr:hypothetical protein [Rhodospirillales bacterium]
MDSSELSQWQDKLAQAHRALSAANALGDTGRAAEQTQNVAAIEEKIAAVKRRAADEGLRSQLQTIDQEMDAYQTGSAERVRIAKQEADLVRRTEGEKGALYRETTNKLRAEQRAATEAQRQARLSDLDGAQQVAQQDYAIQEQSIQLKRQLGQISATQEMQDLQKLKQQEYLVELQALQQKERLWQQGSKEYQKIQSQILVLQRKHEMEMRQIEAQSITQQQQKWTGFFSGLKSSFNSSVMGMIQGTQTFGQAVGNIFLGLGQAVFGVFEDMAAKWLVSQIVGTQAAATSARTEIGANAAVAGSAAFASTAAIPIIGPELAPAAASAAYASTMAFQAAVPGFAVGAWDLPSDTLAMVHQGETIMPKTFAEGFRENGGFGSSSGDVHVHLQAWDGPS